MNGQLRSLLKLKKKISLLEVKTLLKKEVVLTTPIFQIALKRSLLASNQCQTWTNILSYCIKCNALAVQTLDTLVLKALSSTTLPPLETHQVNSSSGMEPNQVHSHFSLSIRIMCLLVIPSVCAQVLRGSIQIIDVSMISIFKLETFQSAKLLNKEDLNGNQTIQHTVLILVSGNRILRKVTLVAVTAFISIRVTLAIDIKL